MFVGVKGGRGEGQGKVGSAKAESKGGEKGTNRKSLLQKERGGRGLLEQECGKRNKKDCDPGFPWEHKKFCS